MLLRGVLRRKKSFALQLSHHLTAAPAVVRLVTLVPPVREQHLVHKLQSPQPAEPQAHIPILAVPKIHIEEARLLVGRPPRQKQTRRIKRAGPNKRFKHRGRLQRPLPDLPVQISQPPSAKRRKPPGIERIPLRIDKLRHPVRAHRPHTFAQAPSKRLQRVRFPHVVRIHKTHVLRERATFQKTAVTRHGRSTTPLAHQADPTVQSCHRLDNRTSLVLGSVVHNHAFPIRETLNPNTRERLTNECLTVVSGHDNANAGRFRHCAASVQNSKKGCPAGASDSRCNPQAKTPPKTRVRVPPRRPDASAWRCLPIPRAETP